MREKLIAAIAAVIAAAGALITALPVPGWVRRARRRRALMRAFLHAAEDGQLRAKFRREKEVFGDGFVDIFTGTAGTLRFRLSRRFRPFQDIDTYHLELGHDGAEDGSGREAFAFEIGTPEKGGHPVAETYLALRKKYPMGAIKSEAS